MIDVHAHILPGVDDGAANMEEAIALAELAVEGGVNTLVATPHSNQPGNFENYKSEELLKAFDQLQIRIKKENIPLELLRGMEIFALQGVGGRIRDGSLFGINEGPYFLVEFPFDAPAEWIGDRLEEILEEEKIPLIAHPERYRCVGEYPSIVYQWLRMGCRTQMNKGSILGRFGRRVRHTAELMLEYEMITCVASDAHSPYHRTTFMEDVQNELAERWGGDAAFLLLEKNPERIIRGRRTPEHGYAPIQKRRWFL